MKICAACHEHLPKDSYSKKQWRLDERQRRCKVCTANNREIQTLPKKQDKDTEDKIISTEEVIKSLDSMCMENMKEISDEDLFKQPPPEEDCPICFLQLPFLDPTGKKYYSCCGKTICSGCSHAPVYDDQGNEVDNEKCPFCRTPWANSDEEMNERRKKRVEAGDPIAIHNHGFFYSTGMYGFKQDYTKALDLWYRAAELGHAESYNNIGYAYQYGEGVEVDKEKAIYYWELAAMGGDAKARYNIGNMESNAGNTERALKHHMIAVVGGYSKSLGTIKDLYSKGHATKEDYTKALQSYQTYLSEIKSPRRDEAAAFDNKRYLYY